MISILQNKTLWAFIAGWALTPAAFAETLSTSDFFCRPLGTSTVSNEIKNRAFALTPDQKSAWDSDPKLQALVTGFVAQTMGPARYFGSGGGACGNLPGGDPRAQGTCQQTVECAVVPHGLQFKVLASYRTMNPGAAKRPDGSPITFSDIGSQAKQRYIEELAHDDEKLDWKISTVTCQGMKPVGPGRAPTCPPPDACKGDVERDGMTAMTNHAIESRQNPMGLKDVDNRSLNSGSGAGAGK